MRLPLSERNAILLATALIVLAPGLFMSSSFHLRIGALAFIAAIAALGLNLLMGYAGQVSLGHAGFYAIGGYACAILPARFGVDPIVSGLVGCVAASLLALIIGGPILRLKGHYLAVATLGFGFLVTLVLNNEGWLTGGPDGISIARAKFFGTPLRGPALWYWITGGFLFLTVLGAVNLIDSPTGRALRALRDSPVAAQTVGVDLARYKLIVFVVSALYAALASALQALFNNQMTPDAAGFLHSVEMVTMVVIGGMGSIIGSLIGAAFLVILPQALTVFHEYETLLLGVMIILFMLFLREGVAPGVARRLNLRSAP
jgi:branched-chain amino acid transport system permease protein